MRRRASCVEQLCAAARSGTGLADFGDPYFRSGLRVLLRSLRRDADLTFLGRTLLKRSIALALEQRLLIQHLRKTEPGLFSSGLLPPVIITGLPRTGTTFLHRLLAVHDRLRAPLLRELIEPVRGQGWRRWLRDRRLKLELHIMRLLNHRLDAQHFTRSDEPEECMFAMALSFRTILPWSLSPVHSYLAWYGKADRQQKYREYRDILCLLQRTAPERRLLLKAPDHLGSLQALIAAVPEALIIVCRRDPAMALASFNSLLDGLHQVTSKGSDRRKLARSNLAFYAGETERYASAFQTWPGHILEVDYEALTRRPLEVALRIYERLGLEVTADLENRLGSFIAGNPKDKHGRHVYSSADFGQSPEEIRRRMAHFR